ncbi:hypothetical protein PSE_2093 [Pseudovibrio sp. FO-BEG1]|uniref:hypothetical protein n=1 Tax=Pseudovibrio sp. (strain FO-BEG1) TaxID=911045 RepID=UPI000238C26F|nr:hypothetical protein [Pseudovibrio sp. FO-BEG1]AEV36603.1 hypothetical protein PSE_2093 [Pseudovibrio sp. FO-BEG1]
MASEAELLSSLCFQIARVLHESLVDPQAKDGAEDIYDYGQAPYTSACWLLVRFDVLQDVTNNTFNVIVPFEKIKEHLDLVDPEKLLKEKDEIFRIFLRCMLDYREDLSSELDPFDVATIMVPTMELLVQCGYAEKMQDMYRWTPEITDHMIAALEWVEDQGRAFALRDVDTSIRCDEVWFRITPWHQHFLALKCATMSDDQLWDYIYKRLRPDQLCFFEIPDEERCIPPRNQDELAAELRARLEEVRARQPFWTRL